MDRLTIHIIHGWIFCVDLHLKSTYDVNNSSNVHWSEILFDEITYSENYNYDHPSNLMETIEDYGLNRNKNKNDVINNHHKEKINVHAIPVNNNQDDIIGIDFQSIPII